MSLVAVLREQTRDCHVALEESLDLVKRVRTVHDYGGLLTRYFSLYESLENGLEKVADWEAKGWNFAAHRKAPWLRQDLQALGVGADEIARSPRCETLNTPDSFGAALGCVYVLEGSTLGGQMLAKQFHESFGITPDNGGRFFKGYGQATMTTWRAFAAWADSQAASTNIVMKEQAVDGARKTFADFSQWLS